MKKVLFVALLMALGSTFIFSTHVRENLLHWPLFFEDLVDLVSYIGMAFVLCCLPAWLALKFWNWKPKSK